MQAIDQLRRGGVVGIIIVLALVFIVSPAMLAAGIWLLGGAIALTIKTYLALIVFTLWVLIISSLT